MKSKKSLKLNSLRLALASAFVLGGATLGINSYAATATQNLSVSASVGANCTISTTPVAFGAYDPVGAHALTNLDGTGTVSVTCTNGATVTVRLGQGANADTGSTDAAPVRRMADGGGLFMNYALYSDSARSTVWDNTVGKGTVGTGTVEAHTVYGRIPSGQNLPAGTYADTVVASVDF